MTPTNKEVRAALKVARESVTRLYRQSGNLYPAQYEYSVLSRNKDIWFPQLPKPYYQQLWCLNWDIAEDAATQLAPRELHQKIQYEAEYAKTGFGRPSLKHGNLRKVRYLLERASG